MKIIRLTTFLDFGGVEKRIEISAIEMIKRENIDLTVIAIGKGGVVAESLAAAGIKTVILNRQHKIPNIRTIWTLYLLFRKLQPDVVHTSGAEANFHGLIASYFAGVKIRIGEEIGFPNHNFLWKKLFKFTYLFSTKIICISKAVKQKILEYKEAHEDKLNLLYNPAAVSSQKTNYLISNNLFLFITTCRLFPVKNLDNLLLVFTEICNSTSESLKLQIVGDGPERIRLENICKKMNIEKKVDFVGFKNDISNYLKMADSFILPSYSEGFSLSLVEGMLTGLPCISTKVGGPSEIIIDGENGFLVDPNDNNCIKDAMLKVIKMSEEERGRIGQNAIKTAKTRFSVENYVSSLLRIYQDAE